MASQSQQAPPWRRRMRPPEHPEVPPSTTTIRDLEENLILEIFLRLPSLPSLVRAAVSCRAFLAAVRSSPAFRSRFRALHPPPLLGFFFDSIGTDLPSFAPVRRRSDPDLDAAVRGSDFFLTRLPYHEDASPGWEIEECCQGYVFLINWETQQLASYNPLTGALDLLPTPPEKEITDGFSGKISMDFFLLISDEAPRTFRVVSFCYGKSMMRTAIFSSGTGDWQILPRWSPDPLMAQPSTKKYSLLVGKQVNGSLYWSHDRQPYQLVLDTATLQFTFIDLPEHLKGQGHSYMTGETKHGKPCIVSTTEFTLSVWFRRASADGVEKWMLDSVIALEEEVLQATEGSRDDHFFEKYSRDDHYALKVLGILDGIVYLSTYETFNRPGFPSWFLSFCLETRKLEKLFNKTFDNGAYPYIMAWPPSLVGNNVNP
ncbi:unnamed protein product [Urochloa decumbens]|uniref:F-box protein AT5G49610-like beta-propeller domain-containing protein n=1 Tax=Urochloa decumbens TaxID=240449 RepID=A0ABC8WCG5_9POAL